MTGDVRQYLRLYCLEHKVKLQHVRIVSQSMTCAVTADCKVLICRRLAKDTYAILFGLEFISPKQQILVRHALQNIAPKEQKR